MNSNPSVILMGSKPGASIALELLLLKRWQVKAVVISKHDYQPFDHSPRLQTLAQKHGIDVKLQSQLATNIEVDFVLSYMYRHKVQATTRALARRGALNFHAAPLPRFAGFGCYNRAVLEACHEFGVTCHLMDDDFDRGDICLQHMFAIDALTSTALSVERQAQAEMLRLFIDFLDLAENGQLSYRRQQLNDQIYLNQQALAALKRIPDSADAKTVDRYARAFWYPPYPGAYLLKDNIRIEVIPEQERIRLGQLLHQNDYQQLKQCVLTIDQSLFEKPEKTI